MNFLKLINGVFTSIICNYLINYFLNYIKNLDPEKSGCISNASNINTFNVTKRFILNIKNRRFKCFFKEVKVKPILLINSILLIGMLYFLPLNGGILFIIQTFIIAIFDILAIIDYLEFFIPEILIFVLVPVVILNAYFSQNMKLSFSLFSMLIYGIIFVVFYLITKGEFALGDVDMITLMAGLLGWWVTVYAIMFCMSLNIVVAIIICFINKVKIKQIDNQNKKLKQNLFNDDVLIKEKIFGLTVIQGKISMALGPFIAITTIYFYFYYIDFIMFINKCI